MSSQIDRIIREIGNIRILAERIKTNPDAELVDLLARKSESVTRKAHLYKESLRAKSHDGCEFVFWE